jgi:uncharacterized protein YggE
MAHVGGSQPQQLPGFRANRRVVVGNSLGLAGVAGLTGGAALAAPGGLMRAAAAGASQEATPGVASAVPGTIKVIGNGSVPLAPDAASVTVGVDVSASALAEAQAMANSTMDAILAAIAAQGIADEDVQTSSYSVNPIRDYDPQTGMPGAVTGFQVTNMVLVRVNAVDELGVLLDAVVAAGANNIYGVSFFNREPGAAATEARGLAVDDARTKAGELADAAGLTLGRILAIAESAAVIGPLYDAKAGGQAGGAPIAPGTNAITATVEVTFELS